MSRAKGAPKPGQHLRWAGSDITLPIAQVFYPYSKPHGVWRVGYHDPGDGDRLRGCLVVQEEDGSWTGVSDGRDAWRYIMTHNLLADHEEDALDAAA